MNADDDYPRIRDLPEHEREPFWKWLSDWRCTMPGMEGVPRAEQDWYYPWDYQSWKAKQPPSDELDFEPKLSLLTDLHSLLRQVFTSDAAVEEWLDAPDPSLGGLSPRGATSQPEGLQRVRALVVRMIHGVP